MLRNCCVPEPAFPQEPRTERAEPLDVIGEKEIREKRRHPIETRGFSARDELAPHASWFSPTNASYAFDMGKPATRDELLAQLRDLPLEDQDYIEAELARNAGEVSRDEDPAFFAEVIQRANDALTGPSTGFSRAESNARVRVRLESVRKRNP